MKHEMSLRGCRKCADFQTGISIVVTEEFDTSAAK